MRRLALLGLVLALSGTTVAKAGSQPDAEENEEQYEVDSKGADQVTKQGIPQRSHLSLAGTSKSTNAKQKPEEAEATVPTQDEVKVHAANAHQAAEVAKQAAHVANKVAEHSVKITGNAKQALKHALGALHDARVESSGLDSEQKHTLKKAEAHLREATKTAEFGKLKKVKEAQDLQKEKMQSKLDRGKIDQSEKEAMLREIEELRRKLKALKQDDKEILEALDELEAEVRKSDGAVNDELKAELERLREAVDKLAEADARAKAGQKVTTAKTKKENTLPDLGLEPLESEQPASGAPDVEHEVTPVEEKGIDIDTQMPYGDLEPFGREDTAQELTEHSIQESDQMVDQLERAEVAEEKRAVFRALTRLRGAAITSYDGVARSQTGNIDEYNKIHKWRKTHPLQHLADEESDVSKWAFPDNAD